MLRMVSFRGYALKFFYCRIYRGRNIVCAHMKKNSMTTDPLHNRFLETQPPKRARAELKQAIHDIHEEIGPSKTLAVDRTETGSVPSSDGVRSDDDYDHSGSQRPKAGHGAIPVLHQLRASISKSDRQQAKVDAKNQLRELNSMLAFLDHLDKKPPPEWIGDAHRPKPMPPPTPPPPEWNTLTDDAKKKLTRDAQRKTLPSLFHYSALSPRQTPSQLKK